MRGVLTNSYHHCASLMPYIKIIIFCKIFYFSLLCWGVQMRSNLSKCECTEFSRTEIRTLKPKFSFLISFCWHCDCKFWISLFINPKVKEERKAMLTMLSRNEMFNKSKWQMNKPFCKNLQNMERNQTVKFGDVSVLMSGFLAN